MSKKSKLKTPECPNCKTNEYVEHDYHDCPSCNCGTIYHCVECHCEFDQNGEVF